MRIGYILAAVVFCVPLTGFSQSYTNASSVVNVAGGWTAGGVYSNLDCAAQASTVGLSQKDPIRHYSGFLNTFLLKPDLDTDNDGQPDELDPDNDNDLLADEEELQGTAFSPSTPTDLNDSDSDDDGHDDGQEQTAGTDPLDPGATLRIISVSTDTGTVIVSWLTRLGKAYDIEAANDLGGTGVFSVVATTNALEGFGPWLVGTNTYTASAGQTNRFYRIRISEGTGP